MNRRRQPNARTGNLLSVQTLEHAEYEFRVCQIDTHAVLEGSRARYFESSRRAEMAGGQLPSSSRISCLASRIRAGVAQDAFGRIKERNAQRLHSALRSGKLRVIFDSTPVEFTERSVLLNAAGESQELPNDFVWIFAGGEAPNDFLKKAGIAFGPQDITLETVKEAATALVARQSA